MGYIESEMRNPASLARQDRLDLQSCLCSFMPPVHDSAFPSIIFSPRPLWAVRLAVSGAGASAEQLIRVLRHKAVCGLRLKPQARELKSQTAAEPPIPLLRKMQGFSEYSRRFSLFSPT